MPLVRITLPQGRSAADRRAIGDGVHRALVDTAAVPADDLFQVLEEVAPENLVFTRTYLGIEHRAPVVFVQIVLNAGRTVAVKKALYARIADNLAAAGLRREDVIVSLVEVAKENWSFGGGVMSYPPAEG
jgi:4-oxalocrotonate tautomerase